MLTDGLDIYLDRVPTKYKGLNYSELAISESQERMSVVIERKDMELFMSLCHQENVEVTYVADVTDTRRMRMFWGKDVVVDLSRDFIDSAGAKHYTKIRIGGVENVNPFERKIEGATTTKRMKNNLSDDNVVSQKGLIEMFDSTIGASTVLMPYGGKTQCTETQVSVQKLPVGRGFTNTASIMAYGYNPYIAKWSPYHGAAYAVVDACAKVVAAGARYENMRFSYQEYFERMTDATSWGKPLSALLGALKMQVELGLPSIGGKDSMSGTFRDINVPPMLMAFGITTVDARTVISPEFKSGGNKIYIIRHTPLANYMPNTDELKSNFDYVSNKIAQGDIVSGWAVGFGGVAEAVAKMSFGNNVGASLECDEEMLYNYSYGSIVVESRRTLNHPNAELIGETLNEEAIFVNGTRLPLEELLEANTEKYTKVYADRGKSGEPTRVSDGRINIKEYQGEAVEKVRVYLPVFPGTNCDYDTARAFERAGAEVVMSVFKNLTGEDVIASIKEMTENIANCHIMALSGGFSAGDEPDGSGKFIANVLNNKDVADAIHALLDRGGLMLGICNGFQALVKSGLLPYGRLGKVTKASPTLFRNDINRHISQIVSTRVGTIASPWLSSFAIGDIHSIAVSHGEGKFVVSDELAEQLFRNGQVAFQYVDAENRPTTDAPYNPNGSSFAIEGIIDPSGQILGKMGHTERYERDLMKNIHGQKIQDIFANAVNYFLKK